MAYNKIITKHDYDFKMTKKFNRHYIMTHSIFMYLIFALGLFSLYSLLTGEKPKNDEMFAYYLQWSIAIIGILFVPIYLLLDEHLIISRQEQIIFLLFVPIYLLLNVHLITKKDAKSKVGFFEINEFTKERIVKSDNSGEKKIVLNWNLIAKVVEWEDSFYFMLGAYDWDWWHRLPARAKFVRQLGKNNRRNPFLLGHLCDRNL